MGDIIFEEQIVEGFEYNSTYGAYTYGISDVPYILITGKTYNVLWDGTEYLCQAYTNYAMGYLTICIGNGTSIGGNGNSEPFLIVYTPMYKSLYLFGMTEETSHTLQITEVLSSEAEAVLIDQDIDGFVLDEGTSLYFWQITPPLFQLVAGETYRITWDETEYTGVAEELTMGETSGIGLGNKGIVGLGEDTGVPFIFAFIQDIDYNACYTMQQNGSHNISISLMLEIGSEEEQEQQGVDIVLYDRVGNPVIYKNKDHIITDTPEADVLAIFSYGEIAQGTKVILDLSKGDQLVTVPKGYLVKEATILKPDSLVPGNIKKNENVAGVIGEYIGDGVEKTVELSMADGDQIIEVDEDMLMSKVIIKKPDTLVPENIKKDVDIAGIVGTHEGGGAEVEKLSEKDINFYDYDGTLLYSYWLEEFEGVSSLPSLPTQEGLVCQGWNWTLEDIKARNLPVDVGAVYITDDGKTRLYIRIKAMTLSLIFQQSVANGVSIDWGDGSAAVTASALSATLTHTYSDSGDYIITMEAIDGCEYRLGSSSTVKGIINNASSSTTYYAMRKIEVGASVTKIENSACKYLRTLQTITIPNSCVEISQDAFNGCYTLKAVVLPRFVEKVSNYAFQSCYSLGMVSINNLVNYLGSRCFNENKSLKKMHIPLGVTSLYDYLFAECRSLKYVSMHNNITKISSNAFYNCYVLELDELPASLTSIGDSAFRFCYNLKLDADIFESRDVSLEGNSGYQFSDSSLINFKKIPKATRLGSTFYNCYDFEGDNGYVEIPEGVTTFGGYAFGYCSKIKKVVFPSTVTTFTGRSDFKGCVLIEEYDFSKCTSVPTLAYNDNFEVSEGVVIKVPSSLYSTWIKATNWTTYANYIVAV